MLCETSDCLAAQKTVLHHERLLCVTYHFFFCTNERVFVKVVVSSTNDFLMILLTSSCLIKGKQLIANIRVGERYCHMSDIATCHRARNFVEADYC